MYGEFSFLDACGIRIPVKSPALDGVEIKLENKEYKQITFYLQIVIL